ncbi:MAG: hypothetical protein A3E84_05630 [Gammaproteobacteria bacterium RIFCSPHIGHO2_12_FULL_42_13]|nr:MAG: hypothetical protein A3E84_05630 [Gammaproteobacteria bacterium RIFCSPHIGHO2_12_FULL_42_13]
MELYSRLNQMENKLERTHLSEDGNIDQARNVINAQHISCAQAFFINELKNTLKLLNTLNNKNDNELKKPLGEILIKTERCVTNRVNAVAALVEFEYEKKAGRMLIEQEQQEQRAELEKLFMVQHQCIQTEEASAFSEIYADEIKERSRLCGILLKILEESPEKFVEKLRSEEALAIKKILENMAQAESTLTNQEKTRRVKQYQAFVQHINKRITAIGGFTSNNNVVGIILMIDRLKNYVYYDPNNQHAYYTLNMLSDKLRVAALWLNHAQYHCTNTDPITQHIIAFWCTVAVNQAKQRMPQRQGHYRFYLPEQKKCFEGASANLTFNEVREVLNGAPSMATELNLPCQIGKESDFLNRLFDAYLLEFLFHVDIMHYGAPEIKGILFHFSILRARILALATRLMTSFSLGEYPSNQNGALSVMVSDISESLIHIRDLIEQENKILNQSPDRKDHFQWFLEQINILNQQVLTTGKSLGWYPPAANTMTVNTPSNQAVIDTGLFHSPDPTEIAVQCLHTYLKNNFLVSTTYTEIMRIIPTLKNYQLSFMTASNTSASIPLDNIDVFFNLLIHLINESIVEENACISCFIFSVIISKYKESVFLNYFPKIFGNELQYLPKSDNNQNLKPLSLAIFRDFFEKITPRDFNWKNISRVITSLSSEALRNLLDASIDLYGELIRHVIEVNHGYCKAWWESGTNEGGDASANAATNESVKDLLHNLYELITYLFNASIKKLVIHQNELSTKINNLAAALIKISIKIPQNIASPLFYEAKNIFINARRDILNPPTSSNNPSVSSSKIGS